MPSNGLRFAPWCRRTNAERNGVSGSFARINFYANSCADLRVTVRPSCAVTETCEFCDDALLYPTSDERIQVPRLPRRTNSRVQH